MQPDSPRTWTAFPRFDTDNTVRLAAAMRELHARLRVENMTDEESIQLTSHLPSVEFFRRGEISNWMTDAGPLDVLHDMPARDGTLLGYEQLTERSEQHSYPGDLTVRVAALDDIVASKEWANRPKDHEALPELHALQERGHDGPGAGGVAADPPRLPGRSGPHRRLANGLDRPGAAPYRPPERGIER